MASSGMLRRVALARTDVTEELTASIIMVTRISELGIMLAVTSNRRMLQRNIPEEGILHSHHHENLKSYIFESIYLFICYLTSVTSYTMEHIIKQMYDKRMLVAFFRRDYGKSQKTSITITDIWVRIKTEYLQSINCEHYNYAKPSVP
jgi:hypothetical protein